MIIKLCEQLLVELERSKSRVASILQPGISKDSVDISLRMVDVEISFPDELYALYGWRNGVNVDDSETGTLGELSLFTLGIFVPLHFAIKNYLEWAVQNNYWAAGLFPAFESGGGDFYLIDTNKQSNTYKMLLYFSLANPYLKGPTSIFDSLDSCLSSIIECYKEGVYIINSPSLGMEAIRDRELLIWRKKNPESQYYKIMDQSK